MRILRWSPLGRSLRCRGSAYDMALWLRRDGRGAGPHPYLDHRLSTDEFVGPRPNLRHEIAELRGPGRRIGSDLENTFPKGTRLGMRGNGISNDLRPSGPDHARVSRAPETDLGAKAVEYIADPHEVVTHSAPPARLSLHPILRSRDRRARPQWPPVRRTKRGSGPST